MKNIGELQKWVDQARRGGRAGRGEINDLKEKTFEINLSEQHKEKKNEGEWVKPMGLLRHNWKKQYLYYGNSRRRREYQR